MTKFNKPLFVAYVTELRVANRIDDIYKFVQLIDPKIRLEIISKFWDRETFAISLYTHLFCTDEIINTDVSGIYFKVELVNKDGEIWQN